MVEQYESNREVILKPLATSSHGIDKSYPFCIVFTMQTILFSASIVPESEELIWQRIWQCQPYTF